MEEDEGHDAAAGAGVGGDPPPPPPPPAMENLRLGFVHVGSSTSERGMASGEVVNAAALPAPTAEVEAEAAQPKDLQGDDQTSEIWLDTAFPGDGEDNAGAQAPQIGEDNPELFSFDHEDLFPETRGSSYFVDQVFRLVEDEVWSLLEQFVTSYLEPPSSSHLHTQLLLLCRRGEVIKLQASKPIWEHGCKEAYMYMFHNICPLAREHTQFSDPEHLASEINNMRDDIQHGRPVLQLPDLADTIVRYFKNLNSVYRAWLQFYRPELIIDRGNVHNQQVEPRCDDNNNSNNHFDGHGAFANGSPNAELLVSTCKENIDNEEWAKLDEFLLQFLGHASSQAAEHPGLLLPARRELILAEAVKQNFDVAQKFFDDKVAPMMEARGKFVGKHIIEEIKTLAKMIKRGRTDGPVTNKETTFASISDYLCLYFPENMGFSRQGKGFRNRLWQFAKILDDNQGINRKGKRIQYRCLACQWEGGSGSGITGLKYHLEGGKPGVLRCTKVTPSVEKRIREAIAAVKRKANLADLTAVSNGSGSSKKSKSTPSIPAQAMAAPKPICNQALTAHNANASVAFKAAMEAFNDSFRPLALFSNKKVLDEVKHSAEGYIELLEVAISAIPTVTQEDLQALVRVGETFATLAGECREGYLRATSLVGAINGAKRMFTVLSAHTKLIPMEINTLDSVPKSGDDFDRETYFGDLSDGLYALYQNLRWQVHHIRGVLL